MHETKICSRCKETKPLTEFHTRKGHKGRTYPQSRCKACAVVASRESKERKYPTNESYNESKRDYRKSENGRIVTFKTMARRRGLSEDEVAKAVVVFLANKGHCEICGQLPADKGNKRGLHIDHCHETMTFRGLLCSQCNFLLGYSHDNPETLRAGAKYLETHRAS